MWRSTLEIWIAWSIVVLVVGGLMFTAASWITGRIDEHKISRLVLWSRISLSLTFLYSGLVKLSNPWWVLATSIVDFKVGITDKSSVLHPLAVSIPWAEVGIALLLLFPLRWAVLSTGAILMAFLGLGIASQLRGMQVTCGCWGGTMLVGPLWFGEHGGMFLMALAADHVFAKRLLTNRVSATQKA